MPPKKKTKLVPQIEIEPPSPLSPTSPFITLPTPQPVQETPQIQPETPKIHQDTPAPSIDDQEILAPELSDVDVKFKDKFLLNLDKIVTSFMILTILLVSVVVIQLVFEIGQPLDDGFNRFVVESARCGRVAFSIAWGCTAALIVGVNAL